MFKKGDLVKFYEKVDAVSQISHAGTINKVYHMFESPALYEVVFKDPQSDLVRTRILEEQELSNASMDYDSTDDDVPLFI